MAERRNGRKRRGKSNKPSKLDPQMLADAMAKVTNQGRGKKPIRNSARIHSDIVRKRQPPTAPNRR